MASSLLCRSLPALRSIRSSAHVAPDPRIFRNPFFKLHANLRESDVKVIDASWYMPHEQRNALQEYQFSNFCLSFHVQVAHIPGALFFNVDGLSGLTSNMLDSSQMLLPANELKRFERAGVSLDHPVMASCGTGVTACILALGLKPNAPVTTA
ncbi:hypothetical protein OPV22_031814 [Ensete ventricosum]|uniref:Rhodanese domain-containing protein n=1 Tax=Ensete ventricosum TaxID=4639 RepID=A0AAV8PPZ9_ENSVE|nr:hypothetical protein OPV22_031814 [Ensete ventricosum]